MCGGSGSRVPHLERGTGVSSWPLSGLITTWKGNTTGSTPGGIPEDQCHSTSSSKSPTRKPLPPPCKPGSWRKVNLRGYIASRPPDLMASYSSWGSSTTTGTLVQQSSSGRVPSFMDLLTCDAVLCGCMLTYDVVYLFIVWTHKCDVVMTCFMHVQCLLVSGKCFTSIYLLI